MSDQEKNELEAKLWLDFQSNMSAMLYLLSEQRALFGHMLEELVRVGALNNDALERITTDVAQEGDSLTSIYTDLYKRYAKYVAATRRVLEEEDGEK